MTDVRSILLLAYPGMTLLDLVGVYDALRRVPLAEIDTGVEVTVAGTAAEVPDETGVVMRPAAVTPDLSGFDLLFVPGGFGSRVLMKDDEFLGYLRGWDGDRPLASVCTGSLLLGAAGHLEGRRATTHHLALDLLEPFCAEVVTDRRIVVDGHVVTAGGVSSSLDLGLYLVQRFWGPLARRRIADQMEYRAYSTV